VNGAFLLGGGIAFFVLGYRFYGRYLQKVFGMDPSRSTPAHRLSDGIDYVPSPLPVLFGHHFASIAGAGPIVGPVLGGCFGWVPVALWIILGCVWIGAVHDFAALCVSVREQGHSIGHVIERYVGFSARRVFLLFSFAALVLVVAIFALLVAKTFTASPATATSSILFIALAPVFGWCVHRRGAGLLKASLVFVPLLFLFVFVGIRFPCDLASMAGWSEANVQRAWIGILFVYVFFASVAPVWILLQPRDYLNSYLLYAMLLLGVAGVFVNAPPILLPAFSGFSVPEPVRGTVRWSLFPILYVTVACGACSGFHALVCSGTTSKQLDSEKHLLPVGYGAMLLEGVLALMALISIAVLTRGEFLTVLANRGPVNAFASGLAGFTEVFGLSRPAGETFAALTISAFMLTTLDTATRLARFTVQEWILPRRGNRRHSALGRFFSNRYGATLVVVLLAGYLALSGDAGKIWPVFGASNQLLAGLTLLGVTVVLMKEKSDYRVVLIPFFFMMGMSVWALGDLLRANLDSGNLSLILATAFLIVMALMLVLQAALRIFQNGRHPAARE
jgi:carbon starvation protein